MLKKSVTVLAALALAACTDPVDQAAKKNIFSEENPPTVVAARGEKLPSDHLADDPQAARRVLSMSAAELTERIGPHVYKAKVSFDWTVTGGGRVALTENRTLTAGRGGVSGDFHGVTENSREQGMEVYRVGGEVFARSRYGKFRQRLRDRGMAERAREEIHGALRDFDAMFQGRLKLSPVGSETRDGRTAWKYDVSLGPAVELASAAAELPPVLETKGGPDVATKNRRAFAERRELKSVKGVVWVDAEESVVLAAELEGRMAVPAVGDNKPADLKLTLSSALSEVGKDVKLERPKEFLPDQDKPKGIADVLERFGMSKKKAETDSEEQPDDGE